MNIRINTDNHITNSDSLIQELSDAIESKFGALSEHLTTVSVHLSDENALKSGPNDKKCTIEARIRGLEPMAVTAHGETIRAAFQSATNKVQRVVKDSIDKRTMH